MIGYIVPYTVLCSACHSPLFINRTFDASNRVAGRCVHSDCSQYRKRFLFDLPTIEMTEDTEDNEAKIHPRPADAGVAGSH